MGRVNLKAPATSTSESLAGIDQQSRPIGMTGWVTGTMGGNCLKDKSVNPVSIRQV